MASEQPPLVLDDLDGVTLTASQAFLAMGAFVDAYCERTGGEVEVAMLCADVRIGHDRSSKDPAALSDWAECVSKVQANG